LTRLIFVESQSENDIKTDKKPKENPLREGVLDHRREA
jgi:hypothetical protein